MKNLSISKVFILTALLLAGFSFLFVTGNQPALAASLRTHNSKTIVIHMHAIGITKTVNNSVAPKNTVSGDCGTISFSIDDNGGSTAGMWQYVNSSKGPITSLVVDVTWTNWDNGGGTTFSHIKGKTSDTWSTYDDVLTGTGFVTGTMRASDTTGGIVCNGIASDSNTIS